MDQKALISVIVPVYRVEAYLDRCISSIAEQTYQQLEIILVDDGSPDCCGKICDLWAQKDCRVRVIHQKNAGSGAARNRALDIARGELIAFVDSDDYIANDMYEHLASLICCGADIAECGYKIVVGDHESFDENRSMTYWYSAEEALNEHIQDKHFRQLIWNKLYRKEMIDDVRFPVGKRIDDEFFTYRAIGNAKKLVRSEKICYAYRQQQESVMHSMKVQHRLQSVEAKVMRHEYVMESYPSLIENSLKYLWFTCIYQGQLVLDIDNQSEKVHMFHFLQEVLSKYPCSLSICSLKERVWFVAARLNLKWTCCLRNILGIGR